MLIPIILILILLVLLFIPIKAYVGYRDNFNVTVKIGPFSKRVLPIGKNQIDEKAQDEQKRKTDESKSKIKLSIYADVIKTVKQDLYRVLNYMAKHGVKILDFNFFLKFGWDDKAAVGMTYGIVNAVVYTVMGTLHKLLFIKKWDITITPEFESDLFDIGIDCILQTRPVHIMVMGIKTVKIYFRAKKILNTGGRKNVTSN